MQSSQEILSTLVLLWAVIDPIGTVPVFISATQGRTEVERRKIALVAATASAGILLFFLIVGEILLRAMGVPLVVFQIAGGLVLFLFALTMIFGESKPEGEVKLVRSIQDTAIFPLATPSIASPGAMMAVVLLTENAKHSIAQQAVTALLMLSVIAAVYVLMRAAATISRVIGDGGASIVSRVMGLVLASIAAANVLAGLKEYFQ
ncbi:MarC family protein [Accumulibacter sp.]|uniref:MarC family protein n=1 Tax=Accumulibacter sp. TaxID=2053492 RepID=UPI0028C4C8C9|nr:MarC family protein [Accumulibacter sp.]